MSPPVIENLKGFLSTKPPLVIFMICLGGCAVVLLTLAYIVKVNDQLINPDLTKDWNKFLDNFAELEFCMIANSSGYPDEAQSASPKLTDKLNVISNKLTGSASTTERSPQSGDDIVNTSLTMMVELRPTPHFYGITQNVTFLSSTVTGSQIGLSGAAADLEMNVTLNFPFDWNDTDCSGSTCPTIHILTCINLQAPLAFFPSTRQVGACYSASNESSSEVHTRMQSYLGNQFTLLPTAASQCQETPVIKVKHKVDPRFTMMLTLEDRSVINLHLMHTSYFLFVMFVTIFCYAIIKGRTSKVKTHNSYSEVNSYA
ncbi:transmembrane protein 248-like [Mizuhopecten yessoensis]|uniref:transmembrane protein 248-like n=1 Tax=Mizuhopecten yessoensis TaxID=6573 RepID=UPI000B45F2E5|nr:transmembrane protein 248-like [Mizuhopecten yessoensis]